MILAYLGRLLVYKFLETSYTFAFVGLSLIEVTATHVRLRLPTKSKGDAAEELLIDLQTSQACCLNDVHCQKCWKIKVLVYINCGTIPSKDVGWNICADVVDKCQFSLHTWSWIIKRCRLKVTGHSSWYQARRVSSKMLKLVELHVLLSRFLCTFRCISSYFIDAFSIL